MSVSTTQVGGLALATPVMTASGCWPRSST
jgi:hypothetical protein